MHSFRIFALPLMLAMVLVGSAALADDAAAPTAIRADHQAEDIGRLLDLARDRGQEIVVRVEPPVTPGGASHATAATGPPSRARSLESSALDVLSALGNTLMTGLGEGVAGLTRLPWIADELAEKWQRDRSNAASSADALARIAAVVVAGLIAGFAVRACVLAVIRRRGPEPACFMHGFAAALRGLLAEGAGLAAFAVVAIYVIDQLLPQPDFAQFLARDVSRVAVSFGLYLLGARFLLAPEQPARRLLPIRRPAWHFRVLVIYALGAVFIYVTVLPIAVLGDASALAGWFLLTSTAITAYKVWWFWSARHDFAALVHGTAGAPSLGRRFAGALVSWLLIGVALLTWWLGRLSAESVDTVRLGIAAGFTQIAVALLPLLAAGADRLTEAGLGDEQGAATPLHKALAAVGRTIATSAVWVLGAVALADVWGVYPLAVGSATGRAILTAVITIGVAVITGWSAWRFAAAYLAAHAPKLHTGLPGQTDEPEPPAQSRLATALPLVRAAILGLVIGITTVIVLSSLGVDIGPLLAGFGVIGLAISFGSQALVRDIVSGIFFMADDAFRVGEYIDTGRLKGTVEKITLRSVQLRHQSGLVHTIPFGQLQAITNASRDWSTVKFNLRLEHGTDLEKMRKAIKRVGQAMLEDPELAGEIIVPLKLQGVADITDSAIVVRLKFTAKPNRASWVQREALKRVYAAFEAEGLQFASGAVTVKTADAEHLPSALAAASVAQLTPTEVVG
jgi:small-conductance mechanosensitive channel